MELVNAGLRDVRRIAVFRPNALGDFIFCLPALQALRKRYRSARIYYLGLPWHADFLAGRDTPVDEVIVVPPLQGIGASAPVPGTGRDGFVARMQDLHLDLALQMYGGGRYSNPLVRAFKARVTAGMRSADAAPLDRYIAYGGPVNRRLQLLEVAALAGAHCWSAGCVLALTARDRQLANELVPEQSSERLVVVQPGATDPRRRWPPERFAAVADAVAAEGAQIVINGSAEEFVLADAVARAMRHPAINIAGRANLSGLCGLLGRASLVISNDTGPLHLAHALGTPCVGIYWFTNMIESAPLQQAHHRAALSLRIHCPVCGAENIHTRCTHEASFVDDVSLDEVAALSIDLLRQRCR